MIKNVHVHVMPRFMDLISVHMMHVSYFFKPICTHLIMAGTKNGGNHIPYDQIPNAIMHVLSRKGRTVDSLERERGRRYLAASSQSIYRDNPTWHSKKQLDESVAKMLKLHPDVWGPARLSNDFSNATLQCISKLRKNGTITDLNPGRRYGIFRLAHPYAVPQADLEMSYDARPSTPMPHPDVNTTSEAEMRQAFLSILTKGVKDNTYKFALARAILDHCQKPEKAQDPLEIPYRWLSGRFLRYYWHQECKFKIKQDFHTKSTPKVIQVIRDVFGKNPPGSFDHADNLDKREQAEKMILKTVFGHARQKTSMVVPRFQKVKVGPRSQEDRIFYDYDDDTKKIRLRPEAFRFFQENYGILLGTVLAEWTRFLERTNSGLPRLLAKIHMDETGRKSLIGYKRLFSKDFKHCFYCRGALERNDIHVDHFIPWSYIFDDNAWNLVLACQKCNCRKSNSLPQDEFLKNLIDRNAKYYDTITPLRRSLRLLSARQGWEPEIRHHYDACQEYGFNMIRMP